MFRLTHVLWAGLLVAFSVLATESPPAFPPDPQQRLERTCFQSGAPWSGIANLRSDVVLVYGIQRPRTNSSKRGQQRPVQDSP